MKDEAKTKQQLLDELVELRRQIAELEGIAVERKRSEEALRQSEERYRLLAETIPQPVWRCNSMGAVVYFNRRWYEYTGQTADEAKGNGWMNALHPDDVARVTANVRNEAANAECYRDEYRLRRASDGSYRWHLARALPMKDRDGNVTDWFGSVSDIDDQKRAEDALQKAHDELEQKVQERTAELTKANEELAIFRSFAEASGQGFGMGDLNGHIAYVNPAMCRLMGEQKPEDMFGKSFFAYYPEEWAERRASEVLPTLEQEGYWDAEQEVISRQGKRIPTLHHVFPVRDEQGIPIRRAVVITDITQRKRAEEALRREHRTLKHMLRASDHERQLIAYDIHDGLAQQLAGAIMQFQTYGHLKDAQPGLAAKAFDAGMTMLHQGHSEARRVISGVRPPILDESGVVAAIAHLVNDRGLQGKPHVVFHSSVEFNRLTPILESAIYRVVQEGLTNASRHSQSEMVRVTLRQRDNKVRIEIRDWGVGFNAKALPANRFGLAGIQQRTRLLGGRCRIESTLGSGTAILVELPIAEREVEE